jgi:hypothetical protein
MKHQLTSTFRSSQLTQCKTVYVTVLQISSGLLLVEIVYLSVGALESTALSSGLVFGTLVLSILISRIIIICAIEKKYLKLYTKSFLTYTKHHFNVGFLLLSILMLLFAVPLFLINNDTDYIGHGLWHLFTAASGSLMLLSVYCFE